MSFCGVGPDGNDIRPHPDIFVSDEFVQAVRTASPEVLQFLNRKETIDLMFSLIFDNGTANQSLIEILIQLLTSEIEGVKQGFLGNDEILAKLESFMQRSDAEVRITRLAGAFGRIAESQLRIGKKIPFLCEFLAKNLTNISYKETLSRLVRNHPDHVSLSTEFFLGLLQHPMEPVVFTLKFIEECSKATETSRFLNAPSVIEKLLSIAVAPENSNLLQCLAVSAAANLSAAGLSPESKRVVQGFADKFAGVDVMDMRLIPLLSLFPEKLDTLVGAFIHGSMPTHVNECFVRMVEDMRDDSFAAFVKKSDLVNQVISRLGKERVNGHMVALAVVMNRRKRCCPELQAAKWETCFDEKCKVSPTYQEFFSAGDQPEEEVLSSSSGDPSESEGCEAEDVPCVLPRLDTTAFRRAGSWDGARQAHLANVPFSYVSPQMTSSCDSPTANGSSLPSMQIETPLELMCTRRQRHRNVGSISLDDLQLCSETVAAAASTRLVS